MQCACYIERHFTLDLFFKNLQRNFEIFVDSPFKYPFASNVGHFLILQHEMAECYFCKIHKYRNPAIWTNLNPGHIKRNKHQNWAKWHEMSEFSLLFEIYRKPCFHSRAEKRSLHFSQHMPVFFSKCDVKIVR